jgi:hypothetical protein
MVDVARPRSINFFTSDQTKPVEGEVQIPYRTARIEQRHDHLCFWIDARKIGAFVIIAAVTGPGKVLRFCFASMLASHNVFEMKRFERRKGVRQLAIFAAAARAYLGPSAATHHSLCEC